ncbi:XRE family transcriptional regulator [Salicibibacter cibarius]|uniref:XRE family transcriptional regulator n=1 Tax=Salicibibacter cibarius TaxID=2743000 RepID=A0A7T6Z797_9BACI|nr:XRE family transcriptional regulator [Salicibibacter cibarius]QQK78189.1 XRE family transcriptional regulator [Salicibibacter cibarius]QQK78193.1 XRE family transcriptional regulator [Salicibibacter cibarius]
MLRNLRAELARRSILVKDVAELLNVRAATVSDKINGYYDFTYDEAYLVKRTYFPDINIEYLFEKSTENARKEAVK